MNNRQHGRYIAVGLAIGIIILLITLMLLVQLVLLCGCSVEDISRRDTAKAIEATNDFVGTIIVGTATAKASLKVPIESTP